MSELTDADGTWLGLLFFCNFSPMLFFTPIAGVVADRLDRRRILMTSYSFMFLLMSVLAIVAMAGELRPVALLPFAFGIGAIFSFNAPASQAIVAHSVPPLDLPSAISLHIWSYASSVPMSRQYLTAFLFLSWNLNAKTRFS